MVPGPRVPRERAVIYEAHVKGLTYQLPGVPEELRGTYAGLAHSVTVEHLKGLGITTIELLPIHASVSEPFLTKHGKLIEHVSAVLREQTGQAPELSTGGGTSDGRFIAPTGAQVVELGPVNASIHKINEHVRVSDLDDLSEIYQGILQRLLT